MNPLLRAVYLERRKEGHMVSLLVPWLPVEEQVSVAIRYCQSLSVAIRYYQRLSVSIHDYPLLSVALRYCLTIPGWRWWSSASFTRTLPSNGPRIRYRYTSVHTCREQRIIHPHTRSFYPCEHLLFFFVCVCACVYALTAMLVGRACSRVSGVEV